MKKRTRKIYKGAGVSSSASKKSSASSVGLEIWKTNNPSIMSEYNKVQDHTNSLGIGVIGTLLVAGLFGFVIYKKVK